MFRHLRRTILNESVNSKCFSLSLNRNVFDVSEEVKCALSAKNAVVALESAIITHGLPYPENIQCALEAESIIRTQGAIPATVAVVNGKIKVGLTRPEVEQLGDTKISRPIKTSRRDFPYVLSNKRNGGTTVSGTIIVCNATGITFFATGGIGGVHKGVGETLDISADLPEMGKSNVAVISSGVKSILDIPKTLEYLETVGVFVATFGPGKDFPAFYSRTSGSYAPYCVTNADEAAMIVKAHKSVRLESGLLFAVPVPNEHELDFNLIETITQKALLELETRKNFQGKDVTPFLLAEISKATRGESVTTNIALVKNNAKVAADISKKYSLLLKETEEKSTGNADDNEKVPVIIGGSNLDCTIHLEDRELKTDGRIHFGKFAYTPGGVGRNICEALGKLGCSANFISAVGNDHQGRILRSRIDEKSLKHVTIETGQNSAQCVVALDDRGQCLLLLGDMSVHSKITPQMIIENESLISRSPLIVMDSNISLETMDTIMHIAKKYSIPVFYEPTDVTVADKPFDSKYRDAIKYITPNVNELTKIYSRLELKLNPTDNIDYDIHELSKKAIELVKYIDNVIVTLGPDGILIARKGLATDSFLAETKRVDISARHYPTTRTDRFVNVSGAGDCFAGGFIAALLKGLPEEICVSVGLSAALTALHCESPVADRIFNESHQSWTTRAKYNTIL